MFSFIGITELFLIIFIAILVIPPKDFPKVFAYIGKFIKKIQLWKDKITEDFKIISDTDRESEDNKRDKK